MKFDRITKILLFSIAVSLAAIALRPYIDPPKVLAQDGQIYPVWVEPGTFMLRAPDASRQVMGKVMIDLRNGNVWGFATLSDSPYPAASSGSNTPQTSHAFLLGRFALSDIDRK